MVKGGDTYRKILNQRNLLNHNPKKEGKMRLIKYLLGVTLIFMVMVLLREDVLAYNMAEYYPLCQGNEWTYTSTFNDGPPMTMKGGVNGTELVNGLNTIKVDFTGEDSSPIESHNMVMDVDALKEYKHSMATNGTYNVHPTDSPWIMFSNPFDLGDVYQGNCSNSVYSLDDDTLLRTVTCSQTTTLEAVEDISVPYGTFNDCLKVFTSSSWQTSDDTYGDTEYTFWYAHNVGPIKTIITANMHSSEGDVTITVATELTDYNVKIRCCPMTFALGSDANDLNTLRRFRDEVLSKTPVGQEIIKLYYQWSPAIVKAMEQDEEFKKDVKNLVEEVLGMIE
jgi:hypothetical protein